jgi:hypothetical protein
MQTLLPNIPGSTNCNAFLAAYSSYSHLTNVFTGLIVSGVLIKKVPSLVNAWSIISFSFESQYPFQRVGDIGLLSINNVVKLNT